MSQLRENHGRTLIEFEFPQGGKARVKIEGSTEHFEVVSRRLGHMAQPLLQIPTTSHQLPTTSQNQHLLPPAHDFLNDQKLLSPQIQSQNQNQNQVQISDYQNPYFLPKHPPPITKHQPPTPKYKTLFTIKIPKLRVPPWMPAITIGLILGILIPNTLRLQLLSSPHFWGISLLLLAISSLGAYSKP
jgi:hypothetical protein